MLCFMVQFLFEGQEEIGSPHFAPFLEKHAKRLSADYALSADGGQIAIDQAGLVLGLRGAAAFEVEAQTLSGDVHSGGILWSIAVLTGLASHHDMFL
jgi:acetylornithine deacetylase/succinyl-diaminopimelate desuccinylase-like protein